MLFHCGAYFFIVRAQVTAMTFDAAFGRLYSGDALGVILVWRRQDEYSYSVLRRIAREEIAGHMITSLAVFLYHRHAQLLIQAQVA